MGMVINQNLKPCLQAASEKLPVTLCPKKSTKLPGPASISPLML